MAEQSHVDELGGDRELVQQRVQQRFPDVDATVVTRVIDDAAKVTAGARIETFRPLLVEHRASDELRRRCVSS